MTYTGFCRKSCVARGLFLAIVILFSVQLVWSAELEGFESVGDAHDVASDSAGVENAGLDIEEDGPVSHRGQQPGKAQLKYEEATTLIEDEDEPAPPNAAEVEQVPPAEPTWIEKNHVLEVVAGLGLVLYCLNIYWGNKKNEAIARAWALQFVSEDGVIDKNFSLLGPDSATAELMIKESGSLFHFWCSGRRYCQGYLATLQLRKRQDYLSLAKYFMSPVEDRIEVEVLMQDMPQMTLAIAIPKHGRVLQELKDLKDFSRKIEVGKDRVPKWPSEKLWVLTEHSSIFYDLMSDALVDNVFGRQAFESVGKYFRFLHFSSDFPVGPDKALLKFCFALPPAHKMAEITALMNMIPVFIDAVGSLKLNPDQKKRADAVRAERMKVALKDDKKDLEEALNKRRQEKLDLEKEKMMRMDPVARQKYLDKKKKVEMKRMMSKRTIKG